MNVTLRPPIPGDADACGRIMYEAFGGIADQHAFPRDFPSVEVATQLASAFIAEPSVSEWYPSWMERWSAATSFRRAIQFVALDRSLWTLPCRVPVRGGG